MPSPMTRSTRRSPSTNAPKTQIMMAAAEVMTRPVGGQPAGYRGGVAPAVPLLPYPGDQEHLVVHGEPEQQREQHNRDPRVDRRGRAVVDARPSQPHWNTATMTP